jgi:hypothetical protein
VFPVRYELNPYILILMNFSLRRVKCEITEQKYWQDKFHGSIGSYFKTGPSITRPTILVFCGPRECPSIPQNMY